MKLSKHLVFIDIETVSGKPNFQELTSEMQELWSKKSAYIQKNEEQNPPDLYIDRGGIYAEFGKIIVISIGYYHKEQFRVTSIAHHNEKKLLTNFIQKMNSFDEEKLSFCAHNGKEFDYPYLCRRLIINHIPLPKYLQLAGKKPWEIKHIDTMELWRFGDYKNYTSLDLLAATFQIPSSKGDMDGSMVSRVYYENNDLDRIARYCEEDVIVTARVFFRMIGKEPFSDQQTIRV